MDIRLVLRDSRGTLSVRDDGGGLQRRHRDDSGGLGLNIMRYRAEMAGGHLSVQSRAARGTTVTCEFRLPNG